MADVVGARKEPLDQAHPSPGIRPRRIAAFVVVGLIVLIAACASDPEPTIEEFPSLILGTWRQVNGPVGTLTFEGSTQSGIARRSAVGIAAETFTYLWVAPAQISTNLGNGIELTVLFENSGDTLVLATAGSANAESHEIIRYSRVR